MRFFSDHKNKIRHCRRINSAASTRTQAPEVLVEEVLEACEEKFNLAIELTRITFPFLMFVSLSSFFAGILNSNNKFAAAAAAPIILNIILISSLIISPHTNHLMNSKLN